MGYDPGQDISKALKGYADILNERNNIMAQLLSNKIKTRQNWIAREQEESSKRKTLESQAKINLESKRGEAEIGDFFSAQKSARDFDFKQKELEKKAALEKEVKGYETPYQAFMRNRFEAQQKEAVSPEGEVFSQTPEQTVSLGATGFTTKTTPAKQFFFNQIQKKRQLGASKYGDENALLTEREKKFEEDFMGVKSEQKKKPSYTEQKREDLGKAVTGDMEWDELRAKYPTEDFDKDFKESKERQIRYTAIKREPLKRVTRWQLGARRKKEYASMNDVTATQASKMRTYGDLIDFLKSEDKLASLGVNTESLKEYYADDFQHLLDLGIVIE